MNYRKRGLSFTEIEREGDPGSVEAIVQDVADMEEDVARAEAAAPGPRSARASDRYRYWMGRTGIEPDESYAAELDRIEAAADALRKARG